MSGRDRPFAGTGTKRGAPKGHSRKKTKTCPICTKMLSGKEEERRYRPFCSKHCAEIDLGRWLDGRYAIEGAPVGKSGANFEPDPDGDR